MSLNPDSSRPAVPYAASAFITALLGTYAVLAWRHPPAIGFDPAVGLLTWQSASHGAPFNSLRTPDPADISRDLTIFNAWWSPGQWAVPALVLRTGMSLGHALVAIALVSVVAGLTGWRRLFASLGVTPTVSWISVALVAATTFCARPFTLYDGGEVLMFGALPWIALACVRLHATPHVMAILGLFLAGIFLKLSFVLSAAAIVAALLLSAVMEGRAVAALRRRSLVFGGALVGAVALTGALYLRRGPHPQFHGFQFSVLGLLHPLSGGVLEALLVGEVSLLDSTFAGPLWIVRAIHALGAVAVVFLTAAIIASPALTSRYKSAAVAFVVVFAVGMAWLFPTGVNHDGRHFRPVGLMLLPGLVTLILTHRRAVISLVAMAVLVCGAIAGPVAYARGLARNASAPIGRLGVAQPALTVDTTAAIHALDESDMPDDVVFVLPSPSAALEVALHRAVNAHVVPPDGLYHGRVSGIVMVAPPTGAPVSPTPPSTRAFSSYAPDEWHEWRVGQGALYAAGVNVGEALLHAPGGGTMRASSAPAKFR